MLQHPRVPMCAANATGTTRRMMAMISRQSAPPKPAVVKARCVLLPTADPQLTRFNLVLPKPPTNPYAPAIVSPPQPDRPSTPSEVTKPPCLLLII
jgi:hypothetical protein